MNIRRQRVIPCNGGFTLLEIVVALAVLAVALTTLLSTFNTTLHSVSQNAILTEAVTLAREEMERYRIEVLGATGEESPGMGGDMQTREEHPDIEFSRKMTSTAIPGAFELIITVYTPHEPEPRQVYELRQYVVLDKGAASGAKI